MLNALFGSISNSAILSIFADSITSSGRARALSCLTCWQQVGSCIGPLIGIAMDYHLRTHSGWSVNTLGYVLNYGLVFDRVWESQLLSQNEFFSMFFFYILQVFLLSPLVALMLLFRDAPYKRENTESAASASGNGEREIVGRSRYAWVVPYVVAGHDAVVSFGSGISMKFFSIFLREDFGLTAVGVLAISFITPLVCVGAVLFQERVSRIIGRVQVSCASLFVSVICWLGMAGSRYLESALFCYMVGVGLSTGRGAIDQSVILDYTPSAHRGRWNSVCFFRGNDV